MKGQGPEGGVKGVKGQGPERGGEGGEGWASIPGRSRLGLNSLAGPWASFQRLGLHALPFLSFPLCGVCGLRGFTPSPWVCGLRGFTPSCGVCGLRGFTPSPLPHGRVAGFTPSPLHPRVAGFTPSPLHPGVAGFTPSPLHPGVAGCGASPLNWGGCGLRGFTPSPLHPGVAGCGASLLHSGFAGCGASPGKARYVELCALECCVCWLPAAQYRKTPFARLGSSEAVFQLSSVVSLAEACCAIIEAECATWPVTGSLCAAWEVTAWSPQTSLLFPMSHGRLPPWLSTSSARVRQLQGSSEGPFSYCDFRDAAEGVGFCGGFPFPSFTRNFRAFSLAS